MDGEMEAEETETGRCRSERENECPHPGPRAAAGDPWGIDPQAPAPLACQAGQASPAPARTPFPPAAETAKRNGRAGSAGASAPAPSL
jgi:hypothetical protein